MKYELKIRWSWGVEEIKIFETKQSASQWLSQREGDIESAVIRAISGLKRKNKSDPFYCPGRNWSDIEMDLYL